MVVSQICSEYAGLVGSVGCSPTDDRRLPVRPPVGRQHSFVEIDHEIFSAVILSFPLIQEGQFLAKECA